MVLGTHLFSEKGVRSRILLQRRKIGNTRIVSMAEALEVCVKVVAGTPNKLGDYK